MSVLSYISKIAQKLVWDINHSPSVVASINTIDGRLDGYFGSEISSHFRFGSSTRDTMLAPAIDPNADVDYMVIFKNEFNLTPQTYLRKLKEFAECKYSRSEIYQSHPTIVLKLNHLKFELVPAINDFFRGLKIPAPASGFETWIATNPTSFNEDLLRVNSDNSYLIKPLIRLLKYWNAQNGRVYASFELEKFVVETKFWFSDNLKDYFFATISGLPTSTLPDYKKSKVERAKTIVAIAKQLEMKGMYILAETEIQKLIPPIPG